ncbi:DUF1357 family protein [Candidatus Borreliella tachyglossi]|uniref:DUF1357 family protein n=1 Tax=Candidatus Borreliella tachyglossi TaxID=1964448 RepID=UPI0040431061
MEDNPSLFQEDTITSEGKAINDDATVQVQHNNADTISVSKDEYLRLMDTIMELKNEIRAGKASSTHKLSIDEQVAREIAQNEKQEASTRVLADQAKHISKVSKLAEDHLASNYHTEKLERDNHPTNDIVYAQTKALVKKYVPEGTIEAIAGTKDINQVKMHSGVLSQLFRVAETNIKNIKNKQNSYRALHTTLIGGNDQDLKSFDNDGANIITENDFRSANVNFWKKQRQQLKRPQVNYG